jgi:hypothetical protein
MSDASEEQRLEALLGRIAAAEDRLKNLEQSRQDIDPVDRVKQDLIRRGVYSASFITVQSDYYDLTLDQRAGLLKGVAPQLCKSIIFENTACDHNDCSDPTNSRYYCVIIQYIGKLSATRPFQLMAF